eukprot:GFYU01013902.1.p1 GENE.GFYU01013902.1~~GFYU01013902.1.p1  ORF type:complete len:245 (-),score=51.22 GFYU01013902.1:300-1034(-)
MTLQVVRQSDSELDAVDGGNEMFDVADVLESDKMPTQTAIWIKLAAVANSKGFINLETGTEGEATLAVIVRMKQAMVDYLTSISVVSALFAFSTLPALGAPVQLSPLLKAEDKRDDFETLVEFYISVTTIGCVLNLMCTIISLQWYVSLTSQTTDSIEVIQFLRTHPPPVVTTLLVVGIILTVLSYMVLLIAIYPTNRILPAVVICCLLLVIMATYIGLSLGRHATYLRAKAMRLAAEFRSKRD